MEICELCESGWNEWDVVPANKNIQCEYCINRFEILNNNGIKVSWFEICPKCRKKKKEKHLIQDHSSIEIV